MSFLTESAVRRVAMLPRAVAFSAPRTFTTSLAAQRTAPEAVKDGLKTVDRAVSDKLVDGIDVATSAAEKLKQTTDEISSRNNIAGKAQELKGKAAGKASEVEGQVKGTAHEVNSETNLAGKAQELKGKAAGKASEVEGQVKGAAYEAKGKAKGAAEEIKKSL
ncbi:hypothetical protein HJFPF1_12770 [Paramyrothecium foliicola]|nr:hypothetical protein HJFPF1_12770 [Paramyrothecium foliicola]